MNTNDLTGGPFYTSSQLPSTPSLETILEKSDLGLDHSINRSLFTLARGIYGLRLERCAEFHIDEIRNIFHLWREKNDRYIDEDSDDLFFELLEKCNRAKVPLGHDAVEAAMGIAIEHTFPPEAENFQDEKIKLLVALCYQLQLASEAEPFFLSCRKVQALMGMGSAKHAARCLRGLVNCGVLEIVEQGGPHTNKATRYRYVSSLDAKTNETTINDDLPKLM